MLLTLCTDIGQHPPLIVFQKAICEAKHQTQILEAMFNQMLIIAYSFSRFSWLGNTLGRIGAIRCRHKVDVYVRHSSYMAKVILNPSQGITEGMHNHFTFSYIIRLKKGNEWLNTMFYMITRLTQLKTTLGPLGKKWILLWLLKC